MATKKTAKKAQAKVNSTKASAPKPSPARKTAAKAARGSAPAAKKKAAPAKAPIKKSPAAARAPVKESEAKVKPTDKKAATPKGSAGTKPVTKKAASQASPKKSPPAKAPRAASAASGAELDTISGPRVAEGDAAPSFVLKDDSGSVISSETLRGNPYILYFYPKDDTPGCTLEACGFRDSLPRFNAKGVRVIGVSPDSPEAHTKFKKKYDLSFALLSDPEKTLAKAYGVWVKKQNYGREYMGVERSTFVVDKNGTVEKVWRGVRVPGHVDAVLDAV